MLSLVQPTHLPRPALLEVTLFSTLSSYKTHTPWPPWNTTHQNTHHQGRKTRKDMTKSDRANQHARETTAHAHTRETKSCAHPPETDRHAQTHKKDTSCTWERGSRQPWRCQGAPPCLPCLETEYPQTTYPPNVDTLFSHLCHVSNIVNSFVTSLLAIRHTVWRMSAPGWSDK